MDCLTPSKGFSISGMDRWFVVEPKQSHSVDVTFHPSEVKVYNLEMKLRVQNNNFENAPINAVGECYVSDVTMENLPDDSDDELLFGESPAGVPKQISFTLANQSSTVIRFDWRSHHDFVFSPAVGHIGPKSNKRINVTFKANEPRQHKVSTDDVITIS